VSASSFASFSSIVVLAITYLAGIATPLGAIAAGVLASGGVLTVALGDEASRYQFAVNGLMLVVAAILVPDGLVGRKRRRRRGPRPEPAAAAA
jgi:ABC-type branched-subunit amino acid transport system permease subunit